MHKEQTALDEARRVLETSVEQVGEVAIDDLPGFMREAHGRALSAMQASLTFRPLDKDNLPPENTAVLVRFVLDGEGLNANERVFLATAVYHRPPYTKATNTFRGFLVVRIVFGYVEPTLVVDEAVVDTIDGWMPMPS
jgi:hypothetical protein